MKKKILITSILVALLLSGCGGVKVVPEGESQTDNSGNKEIIKTPDDEKVVLNIVDWSDSTKDFRKELNKQFMKDHPNVTVNYTTLTQAQFNETMLAGIRAGDAPDLFPLPSTTTFSTAVDEGWYLPLNSYLEEEFFDDFQDEAVSENVTKRGKEVYVLPEAIEIPTALVFYNKEILKEAGVEEVPDLMDWDEFRDICIKVTENGDGDYYGLVDSGAQKNRMDIEMRAFSEAAGAKLGPTGQIFLKDEKTVFADPEVLEAFGFFKDLYDHGCFHSDTASLTAPEARKFFGEGKAAFIVQGSWCIPTWEQDNPDLDFGVMKIPVKDKNVNPQFIHPFTRGWMGISANSKHPDVAAEYLRYLYSYEYQKKLMARGGFVSIRKDLGIDDIENERMREFCRLAEEQNEKIPNPIEKNGNMELIYNVIQPVVPDFGDIASSIFSGKDIYEKELKKYNSNMQKNLNRALDSAGKNKGVKASDFNYQ